ncbi:MAG: N-acetylglucosamine-6-phosphate deacetylase [Cyanobacteria bacterium J06632_3]
MSDTTVIRNAHLPKRAGLYQIVVVDGVVRSLSSVDELTDGNAKATSPSANVIDVAGDWVTLGAVDLQINGALGLAFPDLRLGDEERLQAICKLLWQQGVSAFCPTLVTTSLDNFEGSLTAIRDFQRQADGGAGAAKIIGAHLEGPFLNEAKRGAHPSEYLQPLTLERVKRLIGDFVDCISIVTLAPEIAKESAEIAAVVTWLREQNIVMSLGHSLATAKQANDVFAQGATMVTHAFNAMPGLHHREPGLLGAALVDERVSCGFIADGQHVCKTMLDLLLRTDMGRDESSGLFLVSDALSPLGLPDGTYPWDSREIEVVAGTARLSDGTLSGTTLPLIQGAQNLVEWGLCEAEEAISLVTSAPRQAIGLPDLELGSPAHLLRWSQPPETRALTWQWLL